MRELDTAVLPEDLRDHGLKAGDMGTIVLVHGDGAGYEVEFMTVTGNAVAVVSVLAEQVRPVGEREMAHVRALAGCETRPRRSHAPPGV